MRQFDFRLKQRRAQHVHARTEIRHADLIAFEAYRLAGRKGNLNFIGDNINAYFMGTEAPDVGASAELNAGPSYRDTVSSHFVLCNARGVLTNDRAARRAQQEFDKAVQALEDDNE